MKNIQICIIKIYLGKKILHTIINIGFINDKTTEPKYYQICKDSIIECRNILRTVYTYSFDKDVTKIIYY